MTRPVDALAAALAEPGGDYDSDRLRAADALDALAAAGWTLVDRERLAAAIEKHAIWHESALPCNGPCADAILAALAEQDR
jgi:hypothetical protein